MYKGATQVPLWRAHFHPGRASERRGAGQHSTEREITWTDRSLAMAWVRQHGESSLMNSVISNQQHRLQGRGCGPGCLGVPGFPYPPYDVFVKGVYT